MQRAHLDQPFPEYLREEINDLVRSSAGRRGEAQTFSAPFMMKHEESAGWRAVAQSSNTTG